MKIRRTRKERRKDKIKKRLRIAILVILFCIVNYVFLGFYKENKIQLLEENEISLKETIKTEESSTITVPMEAIPDTYLNFEVLAKLEVPKINLETYILKHYTLEGMKVCASKFWGPEPNEIGNFCIAGHNYEQENMFHHLIDLEIGDDLYLTDNKNGKYAYTIYNIYRVKPQNTAPIGQKTDEKRIVTLITCVNYSQNRLIVQAVEKRGGNRIDEMYKIFFNYNRHFYSNNYYILCSRTKRRGR